MNGIFYGLMTGYLLLLILRLLLTNRYYDKRQGTESGFHEELYTVVQPILSGDPGLKSDLSANVENSRKLRFLWLVDRADSVAAEIVAEICQNPEYGKRIEVLYYEEVPPGINPKIYKIEQAVNKVQTPYMIVLDDDSVIDMEQMKELNLYEHSADELLITGIPHNYGTTNVWSKLLAAFVNANSLITYFPMAEIGANHSINGMFYILPVAVAKKYQAFPAILEYLCDDLAIAEYLTTCGVKIVQSRIGVNVKTTIHSAAHYYRQLRRWMLFSGVYMKRHFSLATLGLVVLPSILPMIMMLVACGINRWSILALFGILAGKAVLLYRLRQKIIGKPESLGMIGYEILSDLLLSPIFLATLLSKPIIIWRNKKIQVTDGKINYID